MKLWMGHYVGAPDQWFLAWGETKMEAAAFVDHEWDAPDLRSMRPVEGPGALNFRVEATEYEDGAPGVAYFNADEGEEELAMSLGEEDGYVENEEWIVDLLDAPLEESSAPVIPLEIEPFDVDDALDCDCFWDRDVINAACVSYAACAATPGVCLVCEHVSACHASLGVSR